MSKETRGHSSRINKTKETNVKHNAQIFNGFFFIRGSIKTMNDILQKVKWGVIV
jgi:hypothetical protein